MHERYAKTAIDLTQGLASDPPRLCTATIKANVQQDWANKVERPTEGWLQDQQQPKRRKAYRREVA